MNLQANYDAELLEFKEMQTITFSAMNEKMYLLMGSDGDSAFHGKMEEELIPLIVRIF